jgi:hypothetical protein
MKCMRELPNQCMVDGREGEGCDGADAINLKDSSNSST